MRQRVRIWEHFRRGNATLPPSSLSMELRRHPNGIQAISPARSPELLAAEREKQGPFSPI
jgi:hypothetical protein